MKDKGLVVIGVTDEPADLVNDWIEMAKPKYPIVSARGGLESFLKVKGFPSCAVIGPDGVVQYSGFVGMEEGALGDALARTKKKTFWPKSLGKVTKLMTGSPTKAYAELKKLVAKGKVGEEARPTVDDFLAYLEGQAATRLTEARGLRDGGYVLEAVLAVQDYAKATTAFPSSADSKALMEELAALPDFKKELKGGEAFMEAEVFEKEKDYLDAFKAFKSISKKYSGTKIAENARAQAERIRVDGMPGFQKACEKCYRGKRACDKHAKKVKL